MKNYKLAKLALLLAAIFATVYIYEHYHPRYTEIEMTVTAYCPCELCCGVWADGFTASGVPAEGFIIAAPKIYPFGTIMAVPGYANGRPVKVQDRGGAIKGNKIDVLHKDHDSALNWGVQILTVRVFN